MGSTRPTEGEIRVDGRPVTIGSPLEAIELGIGMVHQHFMLVPVMTVAENIVLANEPRQGPAARLRRRASARVRELSDRYGLAVDPDARIEDVSVGMQQRVEILRALFRGARILVLDEPTAVLTAQEAGDLFRVLEALKADGTGIVFISHKLNEVLEVADRVTVLRRGKRIDTVPTEGATEESLARLMVGREVLLRVDKPPARPKEPVLEVRDARGARRPRPACGPRRLADRPRGRDRRPRRRRRQRPERARRGDHGAAHRSTRARSSSAARSSRTPARAAWSATASRTSPRTASAAASS